MLETRTINRRSLEVTTAPSGLPVDLTELKQMLRIADSGDDSSLNRQLAAATAAVENHLSRSLINRSLTLVLDAFPSEVESTDPRQPAILTTQAAINLPMGPVQSIADITYLDEANQTQIVTATSYTLDAAGARVLLNSGAIWPSSARDKAAVRVRYTAGYGANAAAIPPAIVEAIYQVACRLYEGRGCCGVEEAVQSVAGLLATFKMPRGYGRTY